MINKIISDQYINKILKLGIQYNQGFYTCEDEIGHKELAVLIHHPAPLILIPKLKMVHYFKMKKFVVSRENKPRHFQKSFALSHSKNKRDNAMFQMLLINFQYKNWQFINSHIPDVSLFLMFLFKIIILIK